jgi:hypothetical protein
MTSKENLNKNLRKPIIAIFGKKFIGTVESFYLVKKLKIKVIF